MGDMGRVASGTPFQEQRESILSAPDPTLHWPWRRLWIGTLTGPIGSEMLLLVLCSAVPTAPTAYVLTNQMKGERPLMPGEVTAQTLARWLPCSWSRHCRSDAHPKPSSLRRQGCIAASGARTSPQVRQKTVPRVVRSGSSWLRQCGARRTHGRKSERPGSRRYTAC